MSTIALTVATPIKTALSVAVPGDILVLGPGSYPALSLSNIAKAGAGVIIRGEAGAELASLTLTGCSGLRFESLTLRGPVAMSGCNGVVFTTGVIRPPSGYPNGVQVRSSVNVEISLNDISQVGSGVSLYDNRVGGASPATGLRVLNNHIHHCAGPDAIDVYSSSNVLVAGNTIHDICPSAGTHPDACQVDSPVVGGVKTAHVIIEDNFYYKGTGSIVLTDGSTRNPVAIQGIAFCAHADDVVIRRNANFGCGSNAISLSAVIGTLVEDNFCQGYGEYAPKILVRGSSRDIVVTGNASAGASIYAPSGAPVPVNVQLTNNVNIAAAAGPDDHAALDAWLAAHPHCGSDLLRAAPAPDPEPDPEPEPPPPEPTVSRRYLLASERRTRSVAAEIRTYRVPSNTGAN